jgi:hypothetical protein
MIKTLSLGKRISLVVAVFALTAASLAGFSGTANAALSDCPDNYVCIWTNKDYTGTMDRYSSTPSGYCWNFTPTMNDRVSSIANNTPRTMLFRINAGCGPTWPQYSQRWESSNPNLSGTGFNDVLSSFISQ